MNVLFDIPKVQQIDLLNQWLDAVDIVHLDNAICCHKLRSEFLDLLTAPECVLQTFNFQQADSIPWAIARKLTFVESCLFYEAVEHNSLLEDFFQTIGRSQRSLYIDFEPPEDFNGDPLPELKTDLIVCLISAHFRKLETLTLLLHNCKHLTSLSLQTCANIPASVLYAICSSPRLQEVSITNRSTFAHDAFEFTAKGCDTCTTLDLHGVQLNGSQLKHFTKSFPNVLDLHVVVESCADLILIAANCTHMKKAIVTTRLPLEHTNATAIATHWPHIEFLSITLPGPVRADDVGTVSVCDENCAFVFIDMCRSLRHLALVRDNFQRVDNDYQVGTTNNNLTSRSNITALVSGKLPLQTLTIPQLSKSGLVKLVQNCPYLHTLHIYPAPGGNSVGTNAELNLKHLNGTSIKNLLLTNVGIGLKHLLQLRTIEKLVLCKVYSNKTLTTEGIVQLVKQCPALNTLCIHGCSTVDPSVILQVLNACPKLTCFTYYTTYGGVYTATSPAVKVLKDVVKSCFPGVKVFDVRC